MIPAQEAEHSAPYNPSKRFPDPLYRYASVFRPTFSCFTAIYGAKARISDLSPAKP